MASSSQSESTEPSFNFIKNQLEQLVDKPAEYQSLALTTVKKWGTALKFIKPELMTELICLTAVRNDGYSLQYVPAHLQNETMCIEAIRQSRYYLRYVKILTDNLFEKILQLGVDVKDFNKSIFDKIMLQFKGVEVRPENYIRINNFGVIGDEVTYAKSIGLTTLEYAMMFHGQNVVETTPNEHELPVGSVYLMIDGSKVQIFKIEELKPAATWLVWTSSNVKKTLVHTMTHLYETINFV